MNPRPCIYQINLSPSLGGAEVFTAFFSRALSVLNWETRVIVSTPANFWQHLDLGAGQLVPTDSEEDVINAVPADALVFVHSSVPEDILRQLAANTRLVGIAHQALYNDKQPGYYRYAEILAPVSDYVITTLQQNHFTNIYTSPLYGIGQVKVVKDSPISRRTLVDWDQRKLRDRIFSLLTPLSKHARQKDSYSKRPGLTLGIVSRLADLKQFPALFSCVSQQIKDRPDVWVEVFGCAVGYRALREFRNSVAPIRNRVRYWGMQHDVGNVYRNIDYLLTGLPEREALGLNVVEAQMCGTPVLAVNAPPFIETVIDGSSGYLYTDPRTDQGADFGRLLDHITRHGLHPDPLSNAEHLARFEFPAFCQRIELLITTVMKEKV